jgi:hypothetical protein
MKREKKNGQERAKSLKLAPNRDHHQLHLSSFRFSQEITKRNNKEQISFLESSKFNTWMDPDVIVRGLLSTGKSTFIRNKKDDERNGIKN